MFRPRTIAASVILLALAGLPTPGGCEELPLELEVPFGDVTIELDNALVEVVYDSSVQPLIRAAAGPQSEGESVHLHLGMQGAASLVTRPEGDEVKAWVSIDLTLDPSQSLVVKGSDLEIVVQGSTAHLFKEEIPRDKEEGTPDDEIQEAPRPTGIGTLQIQVARSELDLLDVRNPTVVADDSVLNLRQCSGELSVQLSGGEIELITHKGPVRLTGVDSRSRVDGLEGDLDFQLDGGDLQVVGGRGNLRGKINNGSAIIDRWEGNGTFTGEYCNIDVSDSIMNRLELEVSDADIRLDQATGTVNGTIAGGGLTSRDSSGDLTLLGRAGARLEVDEHQGKLDLTLQSGATGEVYRVAGEVAATLNSADLELRRVRELSLTAKDAQARLEEVKKLKRFDARGGVIHLDLRSVTTRKESITVNDETSLTVYLAPPCFVQLKDTSAADSGRVSVTGCEMQIEKSGRWAGRRIRDMSGRRPIELLANVAESADLTVVGSP